MQDFSCAINALSSVAGRDDGFGILLALSSWAPLINKTIDTGTTFEIRMYQSSSMCHYTGNLDLAPINRFFSVSCDVEGH